MTEESYAKPKTRAPRKKKEVPVVEEVIEEVEVVKKKRTRKESIPIPMTKVRLVVLGFDFGTINMAFCLVDVETLKIMNWGLFSIKDSTNEGTCIKLAQQLEKFDLCKDEYQTIIATEIQPRCNSKTIMISGQLYMFYALQKIKEKKNILKIVGYHAGNKIKYYVPREGDEPMPERISKLKNGHYKTKQTVIEHCRRVLKHNNEDKKWIDFFENSLKRDDKSDAYISTLSYIQTNKLRKI